MDATEIDGFARVIASKRLGHAVRDAALPELKGVPERTYDLVAILDVLEHVEDEVRVFLDERQDVLAHHGLRTIPREDSTTSPAH